MHTPTTIGLWSVTFSTTTGKTRTVAVHADSDDHAFSQAFDAWYGEPISRFTRAELIVVAPW